MHWAYITTTGRSGSQLIGCSGYEVIAGPSMPSFGGDSGNAGRMAALGDNGLGRYSLQSLHRPAQTTLDQKNEGKAYTNEKADVWRKILPPRSLRRIWTGALAPMLGDNGVLLGCW